MKKIILTILIFSLSFSFLAVGRVQAQAISVNDIIGNGALNKIAAFMAADAAAKKAQSLAQEVTLPKIAATVYKSVLSTAMKQIAMDSATWLGSGSGGQKPQFITQGWASYLSNIGDSVAGQVIETASNQFVNGVTNGKIANFSFCNPSSFNVAIKIGLGLRANERPDQPSCTLSKISKNLEQYSKDKRFLSALQDSFDPTSNDLGLALSLNSLTLDYKADAKNNGLIERQANGGWLDVRSSIGGKSFVSADLGSSAAKDKAFNNKFTDTKTQGDIVNQKAKEDYLNANGCSDATASCSADIISKGYEAGDQAEAAYVNNAGSAAVEDLWSQVDSGKISHEVAIAKQDSIANAAQEQALKELASPPGFASKFFTSGWDQLGGAMFTTTQDVLVDSANVFLNQLALTAFQTMMKNLAGQSSGAGVSGYTGDHGASLLTSREAGGYNPGVVGAERKNAKILAADFTTRADYDILAELSMCPDPNKAGPTECIIDDGFRQAIEGRKTIAQAMNEGQLLGSRVFGFISPEKEPTYNEGLPYRSMLVLRKYRILPVGWELAAQYIKKNLINGEIDASKKVFTLKDMVDCFSLTDEHDGYSQNWCVGLVDPNWLLKSTKNYCAKQGFGPIVNTQIDGNGGVSVNRSDDYCADEQSCIKENSNGTCEAYGYCTEDRRTWNFGKDAKSCEPVFNTCQTFTNAKTNQTVSYLQNTLNYDAGNCSMDVVGCASYCNDISFDVASKKYSYNCTATSPVAVNSGGTGRFFFDYDAKNCAATDEGCHQFIRTKAGLGANLLQNSGFETVDLPEGFATLGTRSTAEGYNSSSSLQLSLGAKTSTVTVGRDTANQAYVLSFYAKDCDVNDKVAFKNDINDFQNFFATTTSTWSRVTLNRIISLSGNRPGLQSELEINWNIASPSCKIDNVKLEYGLDSTGYSQYAERAMIYEKLAPAYLTCTGATTDPAECANFARTCTEDELGCEMYTAKSDGLTLPAKVAPKDYCVKECVDYKDYIQTASTFDSSREENLIANTGAKCSLESAGCDEFTNLDNIGKGGEQKEYFSYLKQCVKKDDPADAALCADFYTWQGSTETGFRLVTEKLKASTSLQEPAVTVNDSAVCNKDIYKLNPDAPGYRADCLQYYDKDGNISYHLPEKTITCSDNCHPFRRTAINYDPAVTAAACTGPDRQLNTETSECIVCKEGGKIQGSIATGDLQCVYQAIPSEGRTCAAEQKGCREYVGTQGENLRTLFTDTFNDGIGAWQSHGTITTDSENIKRDTKSIKVSGSNHVAFRKLGEPLNAGKTYVLSFLAKGANDFNLFLINNKVSGSGQQIVDPTTFIQTIKNPLNISPDWKLYTVSFSASSSYAFAADDLLVFDKDEASNTDFYLDNIRLTEVTDRYYLIQDSWKTPESCDQDLQGKVAPGYMLNCDIYTDVDNLTHYLRSFSGLCSYSGVGCELMFDTHNSDSAASSTVQGVTTPADNYAYVVYDKAKLCGSSQKGCSRFGLQNVYAGTEVTHEEKFVVNNPDSYNKAMCNSANVGCEYFKGADGSENTFKNPFNDVCEYRAVGSSSAWYKQRVKRCEDPAKKICSADSDCATGIKCLEEKIDSPCPNDNGSVKTFGDGGERIVQPSAGWAGLCSAENSSCTEIIDPIGQTSPNILTNSNMSDMDGDSTPGDRWSGGSQNITLESRTMYVIAGQATAGNFSVPACPGAYIYELQEDNLLNKTVEGASVDLSNEQRSKLFFVGSTDKPSFSCKAVFTGSTGDVKDLVIRKAPINYKLSIGLDSESCNGLVNYSNGCVPFNKRTISGSVNTYSNLLWDVNNNYSQPNTAPVAKIGQNNSNTILKVSPDRSCNKWLTCSSEVAYTDENGTAKSYCVDMVACDRFKEDSAACAHPVQFDGRRQVVVTGENFGRHSNATGYTKFGLDWPASDMMMTGNYSIDDMKQLGSAIAVPNGDFEISAQKEESKAGANGEVSMVDVYRPSSWTVLTDKEWNSSMMDVVQDAVTAQNDNIRYPVNNRALMRVGASHTIISSGIQIPSTADYYLTFKINTKGLNQGVVRVEVVSGTAAGSTVYFTSDIPAGSDWTTRWIKFNPASSRLVFVKLYTVGADGKYHVDNFDIKSVLNVSNVGGSSATDKAYNRDSDCRLYPKADSLSCSYQEESGLKAKGLYGYCLEYDRAPGNPNTCLLWWPGDRIQSDNTLDESSQVSINGPLYYCAEARPLVPVVLMRKETEWGQYKTGYDDHCLLATDGVKNLCEKNVPGYKTEIKVTDWGRHGSFWRHSKPCIASYRCVATGVLVAQQNASKPVDENLYAWYVYDFGIPREAVLSMPFGNVANTTVPAGRFAFFDQEADNGNGLVSTNHVDRIAKCEKISKVVTESNNNKAWSNRVSGNSKYMVGQGFGTQDERLYYNYTTNVSPFGSILAPTSLEPSNWSGTEGMDDARTVSPLFVRNFTTASDKLKNVNAGAPYQLVKMNYHGYSTAGSDVTISTTTKWTGCVASGTRPDPDGSEFDGDDKEPSNFLYSKGSTYYATNLLTEGSIASTTNADKLAGFLSGCDDDHPVQGTSAATACYCGQVPGDNSTKYAKFREYEKIITYTETSYAEGGTAALATYDKAFGYCVKQAKLWSESFNSSPVNWFKSAGSPVTYLASEAALGVDDADKAVYKKVEVSSGKTYTLKFTAKHGGKVDVYLHSGVLFDPAHDILISNTVSNTLSQYWQVYTVDLTVTSAPLSLNDVYLFFDGDNAAGEFMLDSISFAEKVDFAAGGSFDLCVNTDTAGLITNETENLSASPQIVRQIESRYLCGGSETCVPFPKNVDWKDSLTTMYAANYGTWVFNWTTKRYEISANNDDNWVSPTKVCNPGTTSDNRIDCGFLPEVFNVQVNGTSSDDLVLHGSGWVNLTFNSKANEEQRPLMYIKIDWSQGDVSELVNASISDRQDPAYPHYFRRLLDYDNLKRLDTAGSASITCVTDQYCELRPRVMIKDNWNFATPWRDSQQKIRVYMD